MLDDAIEKVKNDRRKRPWQYFACSPRLLILQAERELLLESLRSCVTRLGNHQRSDGLRHLMNYAMLSCRQLCNMILPRLPRELRDRIYEYLLPCTTVDVELRWKRAYEWKNDSLRLKMNTNDYHWQLRYGTHNFPSHCLDPEYLSNNMLSELALTWDRITKFEVDVHDLPDLVQSEHWQ